MNNIQVVSFVVLIVLLVLLGVVCAFSDNPYLNPTTSKAVTERKQLTEFQTQNQLMERQTKAQERIADSLENIEADFDAWMLKQNGSK